MKSAAWRGVSRVWQAGHVPWAPLAGGAIWLGALVPMPNQVNKKNFINSLKLIIFYFNSGLNNKVLQLT
jgi:hypothetical protein